MFIDKIEKFKKEERAGDCVGGGYTVHIVPMFSTCKNFMQAIADELAQLLEICAVVEEKPGLDSQPSYHMVIIDSEKTTQQKLKMAAIYIAGAFNHQGKLNSDYR